MTSRTTINDRKALRLSLAVNELLTVLSEAGIILWERQEGAITADEKPCFVAELDLEVCSTAEEGPIARLSCHPDEPVFQKQGDGTIAINSGKEVHIPLDLETVRQSRQPAVNMNRANDATISSNARACAMDDPPKARRISTMDHTLDLDVPRKDIRGLLRLWIASVRPLRKRPGE